MPLVADTAAVELKRIGSTHLAGRFPGLDGNEAATAIRMEKATGAEQALLAMGGRSINRPLYRLQPLIFRRI